MNTRYIISDLKRFRTIQGDDTLGGMVSSRSLANGAEAVFDVKLSKDIIVTQKHAVSERGVDITLSGAKTAGFMVPVFDFDGKDHTMITVTENEVRVVYQGAVCSYRFSGKCSPDFRYFYNRNGRYRVFEIATRELHIEMESANEL